MGDYHVRFCERLGVKFPLPTRYADVSRNPKKNTPAIIYSTIKRQKKANTPPHKATVWQPFPASFASLPNTCFFATAPASLIGLCLI